MNSRTMAMKESIWSRALGTFEEPSMDASAGLLAGSILSLMGSDTLPPLLRLDLPLLLGLWSELLQREGGRLLRLLHLRLHREPGLGKLAERDDPGRSQLPVPVRDED